MHQDTDSLIARSEKSVDQGYGRQQRSVGAQEDVGAIDRALFAEQGGWNHRRVRVP